MRTYIRIRIERIEGNTRRAIHRDYKPVEMGMFVERAVRFMLQKALEKFQDPAPPLGKRD